MAFKSVSRAMWSTSLVAFRQRTMASGAGQCSLCGAGKRPASYYLPSSSSASRLEVLNGTGPRSFSSTSHRLLRGRNPSFRYRRRTPQTSTVLLERFIKQTNLDGSLVAKAPFNLSCYGSYFDSENSVDIAKNKLMEAQRDEFYSEEKIRRREETSHNLEENVLQGEREAQELSLSPEPDNGAGIFLQVEGVENVATNRDIGDVERKILDQLSGHGSQEILDGIHNRSRSPLHVKLYGKSHLRVDSYSIYKGKSHASHIYVSDAGSTEEAVKMLSETGSSGPAAGHFAPSGSVSIWRPRQVSEVEISEGVPGWSTEEVVSSLKIYAPAHVLEDPDSCLKASFLCPTVMNKIYLETERHGNIELNCKLMDQFISVGLLSEYGSIFVKDVWSQDIKLASRWGDIVCEGTMEGNITAETFGDGDFVSRITVGPKLKVTTERGDISLWGDCFAEVAELYTLSGHVHLRYLYGCAKILVKEQGSVSVNVVEGSLAGVVKSGTIFAHIDKLTEDSFLEVESGEITLTLPPSFPFRVVLSAPRTNVSPNVLNSGEFFLSGDGQESFVSGVVTGPGEFQPTLTVRCQAGSITLQCARKERESDMGFDSS